MRAKQYKKNNFFLWRLEIQKKIDFILLAFYYFVLLSQLIKHIGSAHNKVENYLPAEFCLPRSIRGMFLKIPSTTGIVEETNEDPDHHQDQGEKSSHQISPETVKDLDNPIGEDTEAPIPNDEITEEVTKEDGNCQNLPPGDYVGEKQFVWTVSKRENVFCYSDSDEQNLYFCKTQIYIFKKVKYTFSKNLVVI